jgi:hypothetical protein
MSPRTPPAEAKFCPIATFYIKNSPKTGYTYHNSKNNSRLTTPHLASNCFPYFFISLLSPSREIDKNPSIYAKMSIR